MLFFELIQVALGQKESLTKNPSEQEWKAMFDMAKKQAVVGIAFLALNKLAEIGQKPPLSLLYEWIGLSEQIKARNKLVNSRCIEVTKLFANAGFRSCILKGQGNALMYPEPLLRTSGDIDIWIECRRDEIKKFIISKTTDVFECYHHIDFPIFDNVDIEVHYTPCTCISIKGNKRFQDYCKKQISTQIHNVVDLPDGIGHISIPTRDFNVVFHMAHIMYHFFIEGIGLRHFIDYYYVLRSDELKEKEQYKHFFNDFGMLRFARGVMWIEKECLDLSDEYLILEPDEKIGKIILNEMTEGGNFGQHDERYAQRKKGYLMRGLTDTYRLIKLAKYFPSESIWKIVRKIENQRWKVKKSLCKINCGS